MQERELPLGRDQRLGQRDHVAVGLIIEDAGENARHHVVEYVRRVLAGLVSLEPTLPGMSSRAPSTRALKRRPGT